MGSACSSDGANSALFPATSFHSHTSRRRVRSLVDEDDSSYASSYDSAPSRHGASEEMSGAGTGGPEEIYPSSPTVVSVAPPVIRRPTPVDPKMPSLSELPAHVKKMVCGRLDAEVALKDKVITVAHISCFTDSNLERGSLFQRVYPALHTYCRSLGYTLRVVDATWGTRDEFQFGHTVTPFCSATLRQLAQEDKHLITTVFLNDKYGVYWCPACIAADEFTSVLKKVTDDDHAFLTTWYTLQPHRTDGCYVLQPVESLIPKYQAAYSDGYREWEKVLIRLRNILTHASSPEFQKTNFISNIEHLLNSSVLADSWNTDNVIWLRRTFTNVVINPTSHIDVLYVDVIGDRIVEFAQNRLKHVSQTLGRVVPEKNCVQSDVTWHADGVLTSVPEHDVYVTELCARYEHLLKEKIDVAILAKQAQDALEVKLMHRGFTREMYSDLLHTTVRCQQQVQPVPSGSREVVLQHLEDYLFSGHLCPGSPAPSLPVVLHGPPGAGLTSLAATLTGNVCSVEGWTGSVCVARMGGATVDCDTVEQMLEGVVRQLCMITQVCYNEAVEQGGACVLSWLFARVSPVTPLLVVLDGVERLSRQGVCTAWVPTELPGHVRMCITATTHSKWYTTLQTHYPDEENFLEVPPLEGIEVMEILDNWTKRSSCRLPEAALNAILVKLSDKATPLVANVVGAIISLSGLPHEATTGDNGTNGWRLSAASDDLIQELVHLLEERLGARVVEAALTMLSASRHGVTDAEMEDLLSCRSECMEAVRERFRPEQGRVPSYLWLYLKDVLRPFLLTRSVAGSHVHKWAHHLFDECVWARYPRGRAAASQHMLSYFDDNLSVSAPCWVTPQPLRAGDSYNARKLDEIPHLLHATRAAAHLLGACVLDWRWFAAKLAATNFTQAQNDAALAHALTPTDASLKLFRSVVALLGVRRVVSGAQMAQYLCVLVRTGCVQIDARSHPLMWRFYQDAAAAAAAGAAGPLLWPEDAACLARSSAASNPASADTVTSVFRIPTEPAHMMAASLDSGLLKVVNVYTAEVVRTLRGLDQPRDVHMCADFRAVVLCNRELVVVDLDHGNLLVKLKGVLNIKMPYYGVHDQMHTIALARNRMYVNMLNNVTGDLVTTFKVGEDRFLDSLLVSRNGNICVCGDAVQKPFPLLVWDLHNRKLLYDLRIQGHEFLTKMADITSAGQFFVCISKELEDPDPNCIIVYDLQSGYVFKKWRPDYSVTSVAITAATSFVITGHEDGSVGVWDLVGGGQKYRFEGHTRGPDRLSVCEKGQRVLSYDSTGQDTAVWVWDLQAGKSLGCFASLSGVTGCRISADGTLLVAGLPGCSDVVVIQLPGPTNTEAPQLLFGDPIRAGNTFLLEKPV